MGLGKRILRQSVRAATPRPVRRAMHPVRTTKNALIPRPIHQARRAVYTMTNPLGAAENAAIRAAIRAPGQLSRALASSAPRRSNTGSRNSTSTLSGASLFQARSGYSLAEQADASQTLLAELISARRDKFTPATRPVIPEVPPVPDEPIRTRMWAARRREVPWWRPRVRKELAAKVQAAAHAEAELQWQQADVQRARLQEDADRWWQQLNAGTPTVVEQALVATFADNAAPVAVDKLKPTEAQLRVSLPPPDVMPAKVAHITPSGRRSVRAWKQAEFEAAYRALLGAHLLATVREAWAVGAPLTELNVIGQRSTDGRRGFLFSVTLQRTDGVWDDDGLGIALLERAPRPLRTSGRTRQIDLWPFDDPPATLSPTGTASASGGPVATEGQPVARRARLLGEEIVGLYQAGEGPTWVGRRGGLAAVARDASDGGWRTRRYETSVDPMAGQRNWISVSTFVTLILGDGR